MTRQKANLHNYYTGLNVTLKPNDNCDLTEETPENCVRFKMQNSMSLKKKKKNTLTLTGSLGKTIPLISSFLILSTGNCLSMLTIHINQKAHFKSTPYGL